MCTFFSATANTETHPHGKRSTQYYMRHISLGGAHSGLTYNNNGLAFYSVYQEDHIASHTNTYKNEQWTITAWKCLLSHECPFWEKVLSLTWSCALMQPLLGSTTQSLHTNVQSTTCSSQPAVGHSVRHLRIRASPIVSVLLVVFDFHKFSLLPCIHHLICFLRRPCLPSLCCLLSVGSICFPCGFSPVLSFSANRPVYIHPSCHTPGNYQPNCLPPSRVRSGRGHNFWP